MPRVLPCGLRGNRTYRPAAVHHDVCESGSRAEDPDRLPAEQQDQHVGLRVLAAGATGRAGFDASGLARVGRWAGAMDSADGAATIATPQAKGSLGGVLDGVTAPV